MFKSKKSKGSNGVTKTAETKRSSNQSTAVEGEEKKPLSTLVVSLIVSNLFTFVVAASGIFLSGHLQREQWKAEKYYALQSDLLTRRLGLLDRFLLVSRRQNEATVLDALLLAEAEKIKKARAENDKDAEMKILDETAETMRRIDAIKSEYLAVLQLAARLFGPMTQQAVTNIVQNHNFEVWRATEDEISAMTLALTSEALLDLGEVPASNGKLFSAKGRPQIPAQTP